MSTRNDIPDAADANHLFDILLERYQLKNDAALCRHLDLAAPRLSKMRNGHQRVSAETMLRVHEAFGIPFAELRTLLRCAPNYPAPRQQPSVPQPSVPQRARPGTGQAKP